MRKKWIIPIHFDQTGTISGRNCTGIMIQKKTKTLALTPTDLKDYVA